MDRLGTVRGASRSVVVELKTSQCALLRLARTSNQLGDWYMYLVHELVHAPVVMLEPFGMHGIPFRTQSSDLFKCQRPVDKIDSISAYAT
jgi:hypothetical protein